MYGNRRELKVETCQHVAYRRGDGIAKSEPCTKGHDHEGPHSFEADEQ